MAAPKGNQYAAKAGRWAGALSKRIEELKAMDSLADALITEALTGNVTALKEIADRLDGKPKQQLDIGGQEDNPLLTAITVKLVKANQAQPDGD
jgi:hypothetical protein